jgi:hypothetical protein
MGGIREDSSGYSLRIKTGGIIKNEQISIKMSFTLYSIMHGWGYVNLLCYVRVYTTIYSVAFIMGY